MNSMAVVLKQLRRCSLTGNGRSLIPFRPAAPLPTDIRRHFTSLASGRRSGATDIRRRYFTTTTTSYSLSGFLIHFLDGSPLLKLVPHTLSMTPMGPDTWNKRLTLSIPGTGIEMRKENPDDEILEVVLDLDLKDYLFRYICPTFDAERGTLHLYTDSTDEYNLTSFYTARINNLPKNNTYKHIRTQLKDGLIILTFHKPVVRQDGTLSEPPSFEDGGIRDFTRIDLES